VSDLHQDRRTILRNITKVIVPPWVATGVKLMSTGVKALNVPGTINGMKPENISRSTSKLENITGTPTTIWEYASTNLNFPNKQSKIIRPKSI